MQTFQRIALFLSVFLFLSGAAFGQDGPRSTADPKVSTDDLTDMFRARTADELKVEVEGWQALLAAKIDQIAAANIAVRQAETEEAKAPLREQVNALSGDKADLQARLDIAITAYGEKGGDPVPYRAYYDATAGAQIDTTDASSVTSYITDWITAEDGGVLWAKRLIISLVILIVFMYLGRIVGGLLRAALNRSKLNVSEGLKRFFVGIARKVMLLFGLIVALSVIGLDIGPFIAALGVGGFVLGFALQDALGNFAAGILILMYNPFEIGHVVNAAGITGKVEDISLVSTTFKTPDNQTIIVPNGSVWGGVITNITGQTERRVDMVFGIGYGDDIAKAEKVLLEIVKAHPKTLDDPEPMVKLNELADSSVNFVCRPWAKTPDYWDVYFDVTRQVKERFDAEGISIPFPQQDVHMHQVG